MAICFPRYSLAAKRWRKYALVYSVSTQVIPISSTGEKSASHFLFLILIVPLAVNNIPLRALRVGITQSNISIPNAMFSRMLIGVPTPIKYLGLSSGKISHTTSVMAYISSAGSPTDKPPMAFPCWLELAIYSADCARKSL